MSDLVECGSDRSGMALYTMIDAISARIMKIIMRLTDFNYERDVRH